MACWAKEAALTANQRENGALPLHASKEVFMEEICKFIINDRIYTIYDVDKITGKNSYVGRSHYEDRTVFVEKGTEEQMLLTLKHEFRLS